MLQDSITTAPLGRQKLEDDSFKDLHGMTLPNSFRVAWEGVMLNKLRSFLTTLGIIIGVAAVIVMLAVSAGAEAEIEDQISGLGANLIMVTPFRSFGGVRGAGRGFAGGGPGGITTFTYDEVLFLADNLTNISGVSLEQSTTQTVKAGSTTLNSVSIVGVTADFLEVRDYDIGQGRFFFTCRERGDSTSCNSRCRNRRGPVRNCRPDWPAGAHRLLTLYDSRSHGRTGRRRRHG